MSYTTHESLVEIKGKAYSLQDALRDRDYDQPSLVIGIFMTFFDVHVNRIPYPGQLSYKELDPIDTYNHPMLEVEREILDELRVATESLEYLRHNQRVVNRISSVEFGDTYYLLQIADYDVDCITPFELRVLDIPLELKLPRLEKHFKSQIDSPREADARRQGQRQLPRAAGHIQCEISRQGPGEFHLLGQNLRRVSHGIL